MALQNTQILADKIDVTNSTLNTIEDNQTDAQRLPTDSLSKPVVVTFAPGASLGIVGQVATASFMPGSWYPFFTYEGLTGMFRQIYDMSQSSTPIYARTTIRDVVAAVKTEYVVDDINGSYTVNTLTTQGFKIGEPHGISLANSYTQSSLPTSQPIDATTNIIAGMGAGDRYSNFNIATNSFSVPATFAFKTKKNPVLQKVPIPAGTSYFTYPQLSKGDYFTEAYLYASASNTGSITLGLSGFTWTAIFSPVSVKVFLQGASRGSSTTMGQELKTANLLPTTDPYGTGVTCPTINSMPNVVDWIQVQLGDGSSTVNMANVIDTKSCLLNKDGTIVDLDGISNPTFAQTGSYYIIVKHRTHLRIASATPFTLSSLPSTIDFTTGQSQAYQKSSVTLNTAMVLLSNGKYAMYGGNSNSNFSVRYQGTGNDLLAITTANGQTNVYNNGDVTMNGSVDSSTVTTTADGYFLLNTVLAGVTSNVYLEHIG